MEIYMFVPSVGQGQAPVAITQNTSSAAPSSRNLMDQMIYSLMNKPLQVDELQTSSVQGHARQTNGEYEYQRAKKFSKQAAELEQIRRNISEEKANEIQKQELRHDTHDLPSSDITIAGIMKQTQTLLDNASKNHSLLRG